MADFAALQAIAQRLVDENGGDATFVRFDTTPADASAPWAGSADPRAGGVTEIVQRAVWVQPAGGGASLGIGYVSPDLVKRSSQILLVAGNQVDDLSTFNEVDGPGGNFKITGVEKLMPDGATVLLWFVGVSQ